MIYFGFFYVANKNQLQNCTVPGQPQETYTYDASGRLSELAVTDESPDRSMEYDIFSNMIAYTATGMSQTRAFSYDAFGQHVRTTDQDANKKYYITSGADILAEYTDESDTDPDAEYVYGHNGLMALDKIEGTFFFYKDHLGSTRHLNVSDMQRDYFPYGETRVSAGDETDYQYSGKEYDSGIGLHYFGARYYAANIGRWYTPDPARQEWSPYVYCGNSPLIYVDPDGEWFVVDDLIAAGIGFTIGYISSGLTSNQWGWQSVKKGLVSAAATWVGYNTGGASMAAGQDVGFGAFVGYGITSGAASGATYSALDYSMTADRWRADEFFGNTVSGAVIGGSTGAITASALYGLEYLGNESGFLDKRNIIKADTKNQSISVRQGKGIKNFVTDPKKIEIMSAEMNAKSMNQLGIPIRTAYESLNKTSNFSHAFMQKIEYFTYNDILYNSTGIARHVVNNLRNTVLQTNLNLALNNQLQGYLSDRLTAEYRKFRKNFKHLQKLSTIKFNK